MTRKQQETRKGRAELKLAERAALWNAKPENRQLPSLLEWASIRTLTEKKKWTEPQRMMMGKAGRVHGLRSALVMAALVAVVFGGVTIRNAIERGRQELVERGRQELAAQNLAAQNLAAQNLAAQNLAAQNLAAQNQQNANYAKALVESLSAANTADVEDLVVEISEYQQWATPLLKEIVANEDSSPPERDAFWKKQANAAVCLLELGEADSVWPTPDPSLRSFIIDRFARLGATPDVLVKRIKKESDPASRYALILTLGQFDAQKHLSREQRRSFADQLATLYRDDPDPGVHSAAGWTLRNWQQNELADKIDVEVREAGRQQRHWFVNSQGQTFAVINGPVEFLMGEEPPPKKVTLSHSFAVATHEVTVEQFQKFRRDYKHDARSPKTDCPVNYVSWYDAVAYCNWLNEQEYIPKDQWCYEPNDKGEYAEGMKIAADFLSRTGYRLPTEEEWEFMCRAETTSTFGFGEPVELLRSYAWYDDNSHEHMWSVGMKLPNRYGAFDMHGNAWEWCHSLYSRPADQADVEVESSGLRVLRGGAFFDLASGVRSADRYDNRPGNRVYSNGFRPARTYHHDLVLVKDEPSQVDLLLRRLLVASPDEVPVIVSFLKPHKEQLKTKLWETIQTGSNNQRIRAAAALAQYDVEDKQWEQKREHVVTALLSAPASESDEWIEMLRPVGGVLADPLEERFRDNSEQRTNERPIVVAALSVYLKDKPKTLTPLILLVDNDREFLPLLSALRNHSQSVIPELQTLVGESPPAGTDPERDAFWKKQANAAVCLLELGEADSVWPLFQQTPDPSLRSFLIDRMARLGATPDVLVKRIKKESDPASRYALILTLGQFETQKHREQRRSFADQLATLYRDDPDPGVHSAAGWTLRNWQQNELADKIDVEVREAGRQQRHWFLNSQGQTFAVINGPVEFLMGEKTERTEPKKVRLSHSFAVATHEVTVEQFQKFRRDHKHFARLAPKTDSPVNSVSWYDAVAYCNWLNEQEDIPKDQWCYEPNDKGEYAEGTKIAADFLSRTGYRLPTEEEWEFMCRAETTSTFGFGEPVELLRSYAWYDDNSHEHIWSVGMKLPNRYGAFDMHGNAWEWCHSLDYSPADQADVEVKPSGSRVLRGGAFVNQASVVRSADRFNDRPDDRYNFYGFRPARTYHLSP